MKYKEFTIQYALGTIDEDTLYDMADTTKDKKILSILSKDSSVRYKVANNPNTPIDILEVLSKDEDNDVRYWVADNLNTPIDILRVLSKDENSGVRYWVLNNPKYKG